MSVFSIRAEGGAARADRDEIRRALAILSPPGEWRELRALPSARCRVINTEALELAVEAAASMADESVYWCLNPIQEGAERASKKTVVGRRWLLIDIDVIRPKDLSATEAEKAKGSETAIGIVDHLTEAGWPAPVMVDSGNGWHLLYRIDLPADALSQQICKAVLAALAERFDSPWAKVDRATHDAPRVSKLPGTWARKGPDTADRPHRECRIAYEPDRLDVVPVELLQSLAGGDSSPKATAGPSFKATASDGGGKVAYVRSAIERECCRIALAVEGERNNALNRAAFALGTFHGWPELDEPMARGMLERAAQRAGLTGQEIAKTIQSGWEAGRKEPRPRPAEATQPAPPGIQPGTRLVTFGSEIKPKQVSWLWRDRIAEGFISIFAGKTGIGKSFVLCDLTAKMTTGRTFPEEKAPRPVANVLFISEDPVEYILVPRLLQANGDVSRVAFMTWEAMAEFTLGDIDMMEEVYQQAGKPKLIIFDPPSNFLGGKDEHKNAEVRAVVMRLVAWLDQKQVAAVFVTHVNRRLEKGVEALDRIMGSVAWGTTARIALGFAADPNTPGQCLCAGIKSNLGPKASTLAYEIKGPEGGMASVHWYGPVDISADDAMNNVKKKSAGMCAVEWLEERFRESREWESGELKRQALAYGLTFNQVLKSPEANALPIDKKPHTDINGEKKFYWRARPGWPREKRSESSESSESSDVSHCETMGNQLSDKNTHSRKKGGELSGNFREASESSSDHTPQGVTSQLSDVSEDSDKADRPSAPWESGDRVAVNEAFKPSDELTRAIRFLSGMLTKEPIPKGQFHELGNGLLIDSGPIDRAAEVLGVTRTFEEGTEMWSIP